MVTDDQTYHDHFEMYRNMNHYAIYQEHSVIGQLYFKNKQQTTNKLRKKRSHL